MCVCVCVHMYMSAHMNIYTSTRSNENDENTYGQQKEITQHGKWEKGEKGNRVYLHKASNGMVNNSCEW